MSSPWIHTLRMLILMRLSQRLVCAVTVGAASLHPQTPTDSVAVIARQQLGSELRVTTASVRIRGLLQKTAADTLFVAEPGGARAIPGSTVTKLEIPAPAGDRAANKITGLVTGLLIGAGAGYAIAVRRVRSIERAPNHDGPFQQLDYLIDPTLFGIVGGVVGLSVGSRVGNWVVIYSRR